MSDFTANLFTFDADGMGAPAMEVEARLNAEQA